MLELLNFIFAIYIRKLFLIFKLISSSFTLYCFINSNSECMYLNVYVFACVCIRIDVRMFTRAVRLIYMFNRGTSTDIYLSVNIDVEKVIDIFSVRVPIDINS